MIFQTQIDDIPVLCRVESFTPGRDMVITGKGFGDADPPEDPEFYFRIMTLDGTCHQYLMDLVNPQVEAKLIKEYQQHQAEAAL